MPDNTGRKRTESGKSRHLIPNSLAVRLVAGAALWSAVALMVGGVLLASVFRDTVLRSFDNQLIVLWESVVASIDVSEAEALRIRPDYNERRFQTAYSGWYWQLTELSPPGQEAGELASRSLWGERLVVPENTQATAYTHLYADGPDQSAVRLVARTIQLPNQTNPHTLVIAADRSAVDREIAQFNRTLTSAFLILGAGLLIAVLVQVRVGLSPLRDVQQALIRIRTGKASRLEGDFPREIAPLVSEMNDLVTHNTEIIERARTQVGNLAHALKTPLSVLSSESQSQDGALSQTVMKQTDLMRDQVNHYLARARTAASAQVIGARTDVDEVLDDLVRTLKKIYHSKPINIEIISSEAPLFKGEKHDLEEVLGNILDNAFKWAQSRVRVVISAEEAPRGDEPKGRMWFIIEVEDDGPGLSQEEQVQVMNRGTRLDETTPGSGLGLSIVNDIASLYRGDVHLTASPLGGLKVRVRLPSASGDAAALE